MPEIDQRLLKNLTKLSRIKCMEEEEESLLGDLKKILHYIEQLQEIDTEDVIPCDHVSKSVVNVMREDEPARTLDRRDFLSNVSEHVEGMVKVPPIIRKGKK